MKQSKNNNNIYNEFKTIKIDNRKNYYLVVDTETANSLEQPLVYDFGFTVCDKKGNIYYKKSIIISEIFFDERAKYYNNELMNTSYYNEKLPQYYKGLKSKYWQPMYMLQAQKLVRAVIKYFKIKKVYMYNARFDIKALNVTLRYVTKSQRRFFFPYGTEIGCIWNYASQTVLSQKMYGYVACENDWISEKGNILTNAEVCYRYLTAQYGFIESHTALEDCIIETYILAQCFKQHKKVDDNPYKALNWRLVQKAHKEVKEIYLKNK